MFRTLRYYDACTMLLSRHITPHHPPHQKSTFTFFLRFFFFDFLCWVCGLALGDVRAMFFSIRKRCQHALSPLETSMDLLLELFGNRRPTLAAHLTTTTAHHGLAPRTTQAGATSGALDTHRSTLGDRRHVACDIHDSHRDPLNQRYGFRHATIPMRSPPT